ARTFNVNICLKPIEREVRFPDVLYLLGKADLEHPSNPRDSLNFLYQTLIDNPTFVIELSSHTDYRGSDQANQKLSEARAKSCVEYLISKGIPAARMKAKGYGEKRPLEVKGLVDGKVVVLYTLTEAYINKTTKGQSKEEYEAMMQKNRRTVFSVLSKDFVDPNAPATPTPTTPPVEPKPEDE
ncbi:MAG: OmpA family protein, partial [Bacteroidetes bacterium]|nr:OmpA family protein [Bacteroidota bacterium]